MLDSLHWCAKQRNRTSVLLGELWYIYISVHLVSIYTLTFSYILLVLALNHIMHKSSYCKCSLAWRQAKTFLLFTISTHPLQMREYPLQYASTDKNKKSHYSSHFDFLTDIIATNNASMLYRGHVKTPYRIHQTHPLSPWQDIRRTLSAKLTLKLTGGGGSYGPNVCFSRILLQTACAFLTVFFF